MSGHSNHAPDTDDMHTPILPGRGASDYERYLRTDELLALQKEPGERIHRDELLFQTVHQASELWLKLAGNEVDQAAAEIEAGHLANARRMLDRAVLCLQYVTTQLDMLNKMDPWEYQQIRVVLGHGSGFDSPGFRRLPHATQRLWAAFDARLSERGFYAALLADLRSVVPTPLPLRARAETSRASCVGDRHRGSSVISGLDGEQRRNHQVEVPGA